jgi:hypothetical protein
LKHPYTLPKTGRLGVEKYSLGSKSQTPGV